MLKMKFKIEDETPPDGGAGAGAAPDATGGQQDSQPSGSVLSDAAKAAQQGEHDTAPDAWIPEKYRVAKEDGTLDVEASARKIEEARSALEKRLGSGDAPPKTPDEYKPEINVEGFDWDAIKDDETTRGFIAEAHKAGLNNAQLSFVLNEWFNRAPQITQGAAALAQDEAAEELRKSWVSDQDYQANVVNAYRAFDAYADPADRDRMDEIGNNPIVLRLLANIGKGLQEDSPPAEGGAAAGVSIEKLLASEAYTNPKHPEHAAVSERIRKHYEKKYGTRAAI